jgi:hypothetical protein
MADEDPMATPPADVPAGDVAPVEGEEAKEGEEKPAEGETAPEGEETKEEEGVPAADQPAA